MCENVTFAAGKRSVPAEIAGMVEILPECWDGYMGPNTDMTMEMSNLDILETNALVDICQIEILQNLKRLVLLLVNFPAPLRLAQGILNTHKMTNSSLHEATVMITMLLVCSHAVEDKD